jgi:GT2 family glycosyltransferase
VEAVICLGQALKQLLFLPFRVLAGNGEDHFPSLPLPHPASHHEEGRKAHANGDLLLALHHLRQATQGHGGQQWSRQNLGTVLANLGRHWEATGWLQPLVQQLPQDPWIAYALAEAALELGDSSGAQAWLGEAERRGAAAAALAPLRRWLGAGWAPIDGWETAVASFLETDGWAPDPDLLLPTWENHDQGMAAPAWGPMEAQLTAALPRQSVAVVIPSRDRPDLLGPCFQSLEKLGKWGQAESVICQVVLVDNGSCQPRTAKLLHHWQERKGEAFKLLRLDEAFNWSRLSNAGAQASGGSLLLFLNDDTRLLNGETMGWLARAALQPAIGPVGALLLDDRGRVADGGLVQQPQGWWARWRGWPLEHLPAWACHSAWPTDAVTGACLMVRRELWQQVPLDEGLPEDGNDVAFACSLRELGFQSLLLGAARMLHGVSSTRGVCRAGAST